jgi:hypothetical protein
LFHRCYAPQLVAMGPSQWARTDLPGAGAIDAQDAWLMAALDYVRNVMNRLEVDLWNEAMKRRESRRNSG